jgi:hypothetical protein
LRPICGQVVPIWVVLAGVALLLAVTSRLPGVGVQPAAWAILSGLAIFPWLVLTGNFIAVIEGLCGAAAAFAIVRSRPLAFGAAIGIAAFLKVQPAAYLLAGFVRWPARQASIAAATAAAVFVTLHLVTFAVTPVAFGQYWNAVATGWDGLVQAELRFGSENNPSVFAFLPIAMDHLGAGAGAGYALAALAAMAFAVLWYWRWRAARRSEDARVWLALLAMGVMALAYPRFKPYTMVFLLPAMAMILARLQGAQLNIGLAVACLLPNVALIGMTWLSTGPPMPVPVVFALQYAQWVLIACALALALTPSVMRQLTKPSTG